METVKFLGWSGGCEGMRPFPLFCARRPDGKEDCWGAVTLKKKGIRVPHYPSYQEWLADTMKAAPVVHLGRDFKICCFKNEHWIIRRMEFTTDRPDLGLIVKRWDDCYCPKGDPSHD